MNEHKYNSLAKEYSNGFPNRNEPKRYKSDVIDKHENGLVSAYVKDISGWEAYRRWLTRVQTPEKQRTPLDPGLYTWKGYRNWSDHVRREWDAKD
jgi:hypothetical protein